jgi:sugar lactone lactonase YvrE
MQTETLRIEPLGAIETGDILGEGVVWDDAAQAFMWTDIKGRKLYRLAWPSRALEQWELPYRLGSYALTDRPGTIIAAFEQGFARYEFAAGALAWLVRPELPAGVRFNDGRVDRLGRFVAGTMVEDAELAGGARLGRLFRLEADNSLTQLVDGIGITNSLCWSPDGRRMYHADSTVGTINRYAYPTPEGPGTPDALHTFNGGAAPDGATVDAEGRLWIALWGGARVECRDPQMHLVARVDVPVSQPTCVAFGGPDLDVLAVTTASEDVSEPLAGSLFLFRTGARGLPECRVTI